MKRKYDKPAMHVVLLQHKTTLLAGSVINPDEPNKPAGAPDLFEDSEFEEMKDLLFGG